MFGLHAAYGYEMYWRYTGAIGDSQVFPESLGEHDLYVQRETRLAVPIGIGPFSRTRSTDFMIGAVFSVAFNQSEGREPRSSMYRWTGRAPIEAALIFQWIFGKHEETVKPKP
jgi:hypothetical protein